MPARAAMRGFSSGNVSSAPCDGIVKFAAVQRGAGDAQIFLNRQIGENAMSLGHRDDAKTAHVFGAQPGDRFAVEHNLAALRRQRAGDRKHRASSCRRRWRREAP